MNPPNRHARAIFADGSLVPVTREGLAHCDRSGAVLLAVPSEWCLCAAISIESLPAKNRRQAMLYRLEEKLPLAAEDFAGDFIASDQTALGICAQTKVLREPLDLLIERGIRVEAISPLALLAIQGRLELQEADTLLWGHDESVELFLFDRGRLIEWHVLPNDVNDIRLHLELLALNGKRPQTLRAIGLSAEVIEELGAGRYEVIAEPVASLEEAAAAMATEILAGRAKPWVDLGRDGLTKPDALRAVRWPLRAACATVAALMICVGAGLLWRASQYQRMAGQYTQQQQALFRALFPNQPPPPDIASRLAAADREQLLLRGATSSPPPTERGLLVLRDLIGHLPQEGRYRVLEIHLDGNHFTLDGQTNSHAGADAIASALRSAPRFSIEPARTEQLSDGAAGADKAVSFTINGDAAAGDPPAGRDQR